MSRAKCVVSLVVACLVDPLFADVTETIVDRVVTLSGSGTWTKSYSSAEVDSVALGADANVTWTPTEPSTYTGGTYFLNGGLLYLGANGVLGTGSLDMSRSGALSVKQGSTVTVPNKVIFKQNETYCYACAMDGDGSLTLQSVGTPAGGASHHIRIGRASATSAGSAVLSLTQPDSEALDEIKLAGLASLAFDGGTVKARSDAKAPFLSRVWPAAEPSLEVRTGGVTFDVPAETQVVLGENLGFVKEMRPVVAETFYPQNWSFEEGGIAGWTIINTTEGGSGVQEIGPNDPYTGKGLYPTTNGTHYVMIRRGGQLQQTIHVPTVGKWRVVLERGCRDGNYSKYMNSWVMIGDKKVMDMPRLSEPEGFTQYTSDQIELSAGRDYLLSIEVEAVAAGNTSFNFDAIRLERIAEEPILVPFGKSGPGALYAGITTMDQAAISVSDGTLASSPASLRGSTVTVAAGATYELDGGALDAATTVSVAAGGTLKLTGTMNNLLVNGSFEAGYTANYTTYSSIPGWALAGSLSGLSVNGSASATLAPNLDSGCGRQTLVLREGGTAVQTVNVPVAGEYEVSFVQAHRPYLSPHQVPITAFIDDQPVVSVPARATRDTGYLRYSGKVTLTAGDHTFKLLSGATAGVGGGNDLLFDDVSVAPTASTVIIDGTLALKSGSTLVLNNGKPIRWMNVTLDGEPFVGNRTALSAAGVVVTGNGKFSAGDKTGLLLLFR